MPNDTAIFAMDGRHIDAHPEPADFAFIPCNPPVLYADGSWESRLLAATAEAQRCLAAAWAELEDVRGAINRGDGARIMERLKAAQQHAADAGRPMLRAQLVVV